MSGMKLTIECLECGNSMEVSTNEYRGFINFHRELLENNFSNDEFTFNKELRDDEITDPDDVDVTVKEETLRCKNCDNYIRLDY